MEAPRPRPGGALPVKEYDLWQNIKDRGLRNEETGIDQTTLSLLSKAHVVLHGRATMWKETSDLLANIPSLETRIL